MSDDMIDEFAMFALKEHVLINIGSIIQNWNDVLIIPERMIPVLDEYVNGRVINVLPLLRALIIKKCINNLDDYIITFPFLNDGDLDLHNITNTNLFLHVPE